MLRARERSVTRYDELRRQLVAGAGSHLPGPDRRRGAAPSAGSRVGGDVEGLDLLIGTLAERARRAGPPTSASGDAVPDLILNATRRLRADQFYTTSRTKKRTRRRAWRRSSTRIYGRSCCDTVRSWPTPSSRTSGTPSGPGTEAGGWMPRVIRYALRSGAGTDSWASRPDHGGPADGAAALHASRPIALDALLDTVETRSRSQVPRWISRARGPGVGSLALPRGLSGG